MPRETEAEFLKLPEGPDLDNHFFEQNHSFDQIVGDLNIGIILFSLKTGKAVYANRFAEKYSRMDPGFFKTIFSLLSHREGAAKSNAVSNEVSIRFRGKVTTLGYSSYTVNEKTIIVLLSDIASKTVSANSRQENIYYDKISELIAEVAHEIGNPLAGISMSLQVLLNNVTNWPTEKSYEYISRTILEIDRLSTFLRSIREVSKETDLNMKWVDLKGIVEKLFSRNSDIITGKGIKIENKISGELQVFLDENAFYQILLNLLNNSLYILKKDEKITVYIESIDDHFVKLIYMNNGDPIDHQIIDKVFSPFFTTKEKGQGIGLAISLKLMTRMGGTIKVETPESLGGVKFSIFIQNRPREDHEKHKA